MKYTAAFCYHFKYNLLYISCKSPSVGFIRTA